MGNMFSPFVVTVDVGASGSSPGLLSLTVFSLSWPSGTPRKWFGPKPGPLITAGQSALPTDLRVESLRGSWAAKVLQRAETSLNYSQSQTYYLQRCLLWFCYTWKYFGLLRNDPLNGFKIHDYSIYLSRTLGKTFRKIIEGHHLDSLWSVHLNLCSFWQERWTKCLFIIKKNHLQEEKKGKWSLQLHGK